MTKECHPGQKPIYKVCHPERKRRISYKAIPMFVKLIKKRSENMAKILVINGPNLNMLGIREKGVYGDTTLADIEAMIKNEASKLNVEVDFFQSNHEGAIIDTIHSALGNCDAVIINPGAFTHYSYAIRDAIVAVNIPFIEVHISNIHKREEFRKNSVTAPVCIGQISGMGTYGYILGLHGALEKIKQM